VQLYGVYAGTVAVAATGVPAVKFEHVIGVARPGLENTTGPVGGALPATAGTVYVNVSVLPAVIVPGAATNVWLSAASAGVFVTGAFVTGTVFVEVKELYAVVAGIYIASTGSDPTGKLAVVYVATPLTRGTGAPMSTPFDSNWIVPVGTAPVPAELTVSVSVTGVP
jgi:hypothetical protein